MSVTKPQDLKNQLKVILAGNTLREGVELLYNACLAIVSTRYSAVPRDVYVGRFFMNVWWMLFCFSFSKSRWVVDPGTPARRRE